MGRIFFLSILFFGLLSSSVKSTRFRTNPNSISMFTTSFKHVELKKWADANPNLFQNGLVREDYVRIFSSAEYNKVTSIANQIADEHGFLVLEFQFPIIYQSLNNGRGVAQEIIQRTINQQLNYNGRWIVLCGYLNNSNLLDFDVMVKWEDGNGNVSGVDQLPATRRIAAEEFAESYLNKNLQNEPYSLPDREYYVLSGIFEYFSPIPSEYWETDLIDINNGVFFKSIKDKKNRIIIINRQRFENLVNSGKSEEIAVTELLQNNSLAYNADIHTNVWSLGCIGYAEFYSVEESDHSARIAAMESVLNRRDYNKKFYYFLNQENAICCKDAAGKIWTCVEENGEIRCFDDPKKADRKEKFPQIQLDYNYNGTLNGNTQELPVIISLAYDASSNEQYTESLSYILKAALTHKCTRPDGSKNIYCYRNVKDMLTNSVADAYKLYYNMKTRVYNGIIFYNSFSCQKLSVLRDPNSKFYKKEWQDDLDAGRCKDANIYGCEVTFRCDNLPAWNDGNVAIFDLSDATRKNISLAIRFREGDDLANKRILEKKKRETYEDLH